MIEKILLIFILIWFLYIFTNKLLQISITRMKEYNGKNFKLIPFEDNEKEIIHYSHSEILKYPPDLNKYPLIKNAKSFEVILEAGEALFIPSCWWHWVRSENNCLAVSNICEMHPIEEKNSILYQSRYLLSQVSEMELNNKDKKIISKLNNEAFSLIENNDYSNIRLREINEVDLTKSLFRENLISSNPMKIYMKKYDINDNQLSIFLKGKKLNVLVSTNNTITTLEKPNWNNKNGIKPGIKVINCDYNSFLKISNDPHLFAYIGMSPIFSEEINYKIPKFWNETFKGKIGTTTIWASKKNIETGLHYDLTDNILHVISGRKKIILFPPSETKFLYKKEMKKHSGQMLFSSS